MAQSETKEMLHLCHDSDFTGEDVVVPIEWGVIVFLAWITPDEGFLPGDCGLEIEGSIDGVIWLNLGTFALTALMTADSFMITHGYRYYRAKTTTIAANNAVSCLANGKGPERD